MWGLPSPSPPRPGRVRIGTGLNGKEEGNPKTKGEAAGVPA